ncbi:hypothetical protein EVAR_17951_1 [Eumeta japonica]|uniref:Uncharacterized protein n=1 Tax=Eumeta variegata TaxID=151549 RepID=A0A4C1UY91_EUMVA|nr:hypothetical protein EVAR_17951_1 [Eumeta japonica]
MVVHELDDFRSVGHDPRAAPQLAALPRYPDAVLVVFVEPISPTLQGCIAKLSSTRDFVKRNMTAHWSDRVATATGLSQFRGRGRRKRSKW